MDSTTLAATRAQLDAQLDAVVYATHSSSTRRTHARGIVCGRAVAAAGMPAALVCISTTPQIDHDAALVERSMRAAVVRDA
ncbi:MAG: hypothetical protein JWQ19_3208 [Subtercola sp.]|nr:hypothetical protein [Subtercola sp.]